jgi:hypothetical protein
MSPKGDDMPREGRRLEHRELLEAAAVEGELVDDRAIHADLLCALEPVKTTFPLAGIFKRAVLEAGGSSVGRFDKQRFQEMHKRMHRNQAIVAAAVVCWNWAGMA